MEQQTQGVSDGMYIYQHQCKGGVDIHDIFLKKSTFRVLLSCVGAILLLANICCTLLSKVVYLKYHYNN
jgi:phosphatidylinositol N-acetylglucosaminyltransferase subunit H